MSNSWICQFKRDIVIVRDFTLRMMLERKPLHFLMCIMGPLQLIEHLVQITKLESKWRTGTCLTKPPNLLSSLAICTTWSLSCKGPIWLWSTHFTNSKFLSCTSPLKQLYFSFLNTVSLSNTIERIPNGTLTKTINIKLSYQGFLERIIPWKQGWLRSCFI